MRNRILTAIGVTTLASLLVAGMLLAQAKPGQQKRDTTDSPVAAMTMPRENQIVTVAGGEPLPDSNPRQAVLLGLSSIEADEAESWIYFADASRHIIGRVNADGTKLETLAGNQIGGFNGDGRAPLETSFHIPSQIALDRRNGDIYVADTHNHRIRVVPRNGNGTVRTVAGMGIRGIAPDRLPTAPPIGPGLSYGRYSGDGGPAAEAELNMPSGVALDRQGNVYIADSANNRIRVVNMQREAITVAGVRVAPGAIETIAGNGTMSSSGDGAQARMAALAYPKTVAIAGDGDIVFVETFSKRLRRIDRDKGGIETISTGGAPQHGILNMFALEGLAASGDDIYYTDLNHHAIFRLDGGSTRALMAGVGVAGRSADADPAIGLITGPGAMDVATDGTLYFVEGGSNSIRRIDTSGRLRTVAGDSTPRDNIDAKLATFSVLAPIATDVRGNIYIGDANLHSIRRIDPKTGRVTTFAGNGEIGFGGDGGAPLKASFIEPTPRNCAGDDALYIVDPSGCRVRRIRWEGQAPIIETIAGNGTYGHSGDGGPATDAALGLPIGVARNPRNGDIYIADLWIPAIRRVSMDGTISTIAGTGKEGFAGDGGDAKNAQFHWPTALAVDGSGNLYVADFFNNRIRIITPDGRIDTFAGSGKRGYSGDGGPAREASLDGPNDITFGPDGALYVTDTQNHVVRRIEMKEPYRITTAVGTGERGFSGDGGDPRAARLSVPRGIAFGPDGTLYITDSLNRRIRAVRFTNQR